MRKKSEAVLFIVLAAMMLLSVPTVFGAGASEAAKGPVTIKYLLWQDPTYASIIKAFNDSQKNIIVDAQVIDSADYETKLTTMLAGGAQMDAYMQKRQTDMFTQYANGYIEPLDALIKKYNYDRSGIDRFQSAVTVDGKVLAVPFRGASYYTYFNRKIFAAAGMETPDAYVKRGEWTWKKFTEVAEKLSTGDGGVYGGLFYTWAVCSMIPAIQNGRLFITQDGKIDIDESVLQSFKIRKELEGKKAIIPLVELLTTKLHYSNAFFKGNVAMLLIGEWFPGMMMSAKDKGQLQGFTWNDWSVTRLPCDLPAYASVGAPTFSHVSSSSKEKDAAFNFIGWMGSAAGAEIVAKAGFLPAVMSPEVKKALGTALPDDLSLTYFTEPAKVLPGWYTKYGSRVEQSLNVVIQKYLLNEMSDSELTSTLRIAFQEIVNTTN